MPLYLHVFFQLQLYSSGHDQLAQEVMSQISDRRAMAESLMIMTGLRVRAFLGEIDKSTCEKLGVVSTRVNRWIGELVSKITKSIFSTTLVSTATHIDESLLVLAKITIITTLFLF